MRCTALLLFVAAAACGNPDGPSVQLVPTVQIIDGDNQTDTVAQQLATAITAKAEDKTTAVAMPGVVMNWFRVVGTDTAFLGAGTTDAAGTAKIRPSLGTKAGPQYILAFALDENGDRVEHAQASMTALADRAVTTLGYRLDTVPIYVGDPVLDNVSNAAAYDQYGNWAGPLHWLAATGWRVSADTCWALEAGVTDMQLQRDAASAHVVLRAIVR
jgi:hypothetical protein